MAKRTLKSSVLVALVAAAIVGVVAAPASAGKGPTSQPGASAVK
jgi:hypothetical protein